MNPYNFQTLINGRTRNATRDASLEKIDEMVSIAEDRLKATEHHQLKASIKDVCVELNTNDEHLKYFWSMNWFTSDDEAIVRIYAVTGVEGQEPHAYYNSEKKIAVFINTNYYGQCKSWALGAAADYLETEFGVHSIHGACVDVGDNRGVVIIAPTGTGKSTHSYGMMQIFPDAKFHSDDWLYITYKPDRAIVDISEKFFYVRTDGTDTFPKLKEMFDESPVENVASLSDGSRDYKGTPNSRAMINPSKIGPITKRVDAHTILLLRRDKVSPPEMKLDVEQGIEILKEGAYMVNPGAGPKEDWGKIKFEPWYNPYLLVRSEARKQMQIDAFRKMFSLAEVYILNTGVETVEQSRNRIEAIVNRKREYHEVNGVLVPK